MDKVALFQEIAGPTFAVLGSVQPGDASKTTTVHEDQRAGLFDSALGGQLFHIHLVNSIGTFDRFIKHIFTSDEEDRASMVGFVIRERSCWGGDDQAEWDSQWQRPERYTEWKTHAYR